MTKKDVAALAFCIEREIAFTKAIQQDTKPLECLAKRFSRILKTRKDFDEVEFLTACNVRK